MRGPTGDDLELLRASVVHARPSQLAEMLNDQRPWVRKVAVAEHDRREREKTEEVVCREPLRRIVTGFVASWNRERPPVGGQFAENQRRSSTVHVSAVEWLSSNSGIPRGTIENITRASERSAVVSYDVADALVGAIGRPELMYDGTLEPTRRSAPTCCSGSERTSSATATAATG